MHVLLVVPCRGGSRCERWVVTVIPQLTACGATNQATRDPCDYGERCGSISPATVNIEHDWLPVKNSARRFLAFSAQFADTTVKDLVANRDDSGSAGDWSGRRGARRLCRGRRRDFEAEQKSRFRTQKAATRTKGGILPEEAGASPTPALSPVLREGSCGGSGGFEDFSGDWVR